MRTRIRRLASNDYRAVKKIEKIVVDEYLEDLKKTGEKNTIERLITPQYFSHYLRTRTSFVAETDGKVIGFVLAQPTSYVHGTNSEIWLEYIAVLPENRKMGVGSKLISRIVHHAYSHGLRLLYTTLNPNNSESSRLLVKHGFEVVDWKEDKRGLKKRSATKVGLTSSPHGHLLPSVSVIR